MANNKKQSQGGAQSNSKKRTPTVNSALRKDQLAQLAERPSKHYCAACSKNILHKDLLMVVVGKPGGHKVKEPHHKSCFQFK